MTGDVADAGLELLEQLDLTTIPAERVLVVDIVAMDWNCPKYIPKIYTEDAIRQFVGGQIGRLQAEIATLKAEMDQLKGGPL